MKGCDLTVHCPWLPFVWMCEFGECLSYVCLFVAQKKGVRTRSWCGAVKRNNENEYELARFVLDVFGTVWNRLCIISTF